MQCGVTVVNLIHDTATETDQPVCHVIPGSSWREKLDTSGGDPQRTVHIRLPPAAGYLPYFQWAKLPPGEKAAHWTLKRGGKLICGAVRSLTEAEYAALEKTHICCTVAAVSDNLESMDFIKTILEHNTRMVFITAGMGGGTGTGAAPEIARQAKELGILTIGIVTVPFSFEGKRKIEQAMTGIDELEEYVDALLIIANERLREIYGDLKLSDAFAMADNVLTIAAKSIAEIITVKGYVNVDFADANSAV